MSPVGLESAATRSRVKHSRSHGEVLVNRFFKLPQERCDKVNWPSRHGQSCWLGDVKQQNKQNTNIPASTKIAASTKFAAGTKNSARKKLLPAQKLLLTQIFLPAQNLLPALKFLLAQNLLQAQMSREMRFPTMWYVRPDQQRLRPACAYAQTDQSLCLSLNYYISVKLLIELNLVSCHGSNIPEYWAA